MGRQSGATDAMRADGRQGRAGSSLPGEAATQGGCLPALRMPWSGSATAWRPAPARSAPLLAGLVPCVALQEVLLELALVVWQSTQQRAARAVQPVSLRADRLQPAHCRGGAGSGEAAGCLPCPNGRKVTEADR